MSTIKMTRDIDLSKATAAEITAWYNENSGSKKAVKFKSHAEARAKASELYQALVELAGGSSKAEGKKKKAAKAAEPAPAKTKASKKGTKVEAPAPETPAKGSKAKPKRAQEQLDEKRAAEASDEAGKKGRKSKAAGQYLFKKDSANPRREGSHGARSWDVLKDGMTYEEAIAAGARPLDLRHDIQLGRIEVRSEK